MEVKEEVRRMSRKVATLEDILSDFIIITERDNRQLREDLRAIGDRMEADTAKLKAEMSEFKNEMSEFKNEMSEFKNEMSEFKNEMLEFKNEMSDFKNEMADFKNEMSDFKEEMRKDRKEQNKQWGELNNRLGTFAEDVAAPNIPRIAIERFGAAHIEDHGVRRRRINPNDKSEYFEFDAITVTDTYVFLLETKFTPRDEYIKAVPTLITNFKRCFTEYVDKPLITIFASWAISENHVRMLTKMGVYALAMGETTMELLNFEKLYHGKK